MTDTAISRANLIAGVEAAALVLAQKLGLGDETRVSDDWPIDQGDSVLVVGDELYFVSDNGVATCVDARTGKVNWTKRLGGDFSASPVFAEGHAESVAAQAHG